MPATTDDRVDLLAKRCDSDLGDPDLWFRPDGYPHSLALCIIDSIASTGAHYNSVKNVLRHYIEYRQAQGGNADTDNAGALLGTFTELGGPQQWAEMTNNRKPTSTSKGAPLKAAAIHEAAVQLREQGINSTYDLLNAAPSKIEEAKKAWISVPGQRSGITWNYFLMLAGIGGVKADRMVIRFVADAIGSAPENVSPTDAATLVKAVAEKSGRNVTHFDHAIWRFESGRPVNQQH
ncbi:heme peroxidase [Rhodococcus erythropolis]|uniref:heme peroxidase n=1 Tax=Rhodococcus erythropolis TaxID=1833 RepID=UPI0009FE716C|nr:heme peroxidase [Rhodococcus erythropolis]ORI24681.1 heme peroxidase [Rhodococcus erythropolis]